MKFKDRFDAGMQLAAELKQYKKKDGVVVAVPRGGIETGYVVARELKLPLEVVLIKKLGHPAQKEYGIGAVSLEDRFITDHYGVGDDYIEAETERIRELLRQRKEHYYQGRQPLSLRDRMVIIVDDGIATGHTLISTIELIKKSKPGKIIVAIPVSPPRTLGKIEAMVDEVVCLYAPADFYAVGQFYQNFNQVSDEEVVEWLEKSRKGVQTVPYE